MRLLHKLMSWFISKHGGPSYRTLPFNGTCTVTSEGATLLEGLEGRVITAHSLIVAASRSCVVSLLLGERVVAKSAVPAYSAVTLVGEVPLAGNPGEALKLRTESGECDVVFSGFCRAFTVTPALVAPPIPVEPFGIPGIASLSSSSLDMTVGLTWTDYQAGLEIEIQYSIEPEVWETGQVVAFPTASIRLDFTGKVDSEQCPYISAYRVRYVYQERAGEFSEIATHHIAA